MSSRTGNLRTSETAVAATAQESAGESPRFCMETGARLHFGLFPKRGIGARRGGIGMMIDQPRTYVESRRCDQFSVVGRQAELASRLARNMADAAGRPLPPLELRVPSNAPRHAGLGSGTQLAMCVAAALAKAWGQNCSMPQLAHFCGRGKRSVVGVRGFSHGGLIVDAGDDEHEDGSAFDPAQAKTSVAIPSGWRIVLAWPQGTRSSSCEDANAVPARELMAGSPLGNGHAGVSGSLETAAFQRVAQQESDEQGVATIYRDMRRLAFESVIPAAESGDFAAFSHSVHEFNRLAGQVFAEVQGGDYSTPAISGLIRALRDRGLAGVGQSSWGPVVFAMCETAASAERLQSAMAHSAEFAHVRPDDTWIAAPRNHGFTTFECVESPGRNAR